MSEKKKREVHPIIKKALNLAHVGVEPVEFYQDDIEEIKEDLESLFGLPELFNAVVDLINLAGLLEEEGSPNTAMLLMKVVATAAEALKDLEKK